MAGEEHAGVDIVQIRSGLHGFQSGMRGGEDEALIRLAIVDGAGCFLGLPVSEGVFGLAIEGGEARDGFSVIGGGRGVSLPGGCFGFGRRGRGGAASGEEGEDAGGDEGE